MLEWGMLAIFGHKAKKYLKLLRPNYYFVGLLLAWLFCPFTGPSNASALFQLRASDSFLSVDQETYIQANTSELWFHQLDPFETEEIREEDERDHLSREGLVCLATIEPMPLAKNVPIERHQPFFSFTIELLIPTLCPTPPPIAA